MKIRINKINLPAWQNQRLDNKSTVNVEDCRGVLHDINNIGTKHNSGPSYQIYIRNIITVKLRLVPQFVSRLTGISAAQTD